MKSKVKKIPVLDGNGDQLTLYSIREPGALFGLFPRTRLVLGTGEVVARSRRGLVVAATGEKLTRV